MDMEDYFEQLVSVIVNHPNCDEPRKIIIWHGEAGEWGLVISAALDAAISCDIAIPDDLLTEMGNYLYHAESPSAQQRYVQVLNKAGLPIPEELLAAA